MKLRGYFISFYLLRSETLLSVSKKFLAILYSVRIQLSGQNRKPLAFYAEL